MGLPPVLPTARTDAVCDPTKSCVCPQAIVLGLRFVLCEELPPCMMRYVPTGVAYVFAPYLCLRVDISRALSFWIHSFFVMCFGVVNGIFLIEHCLFLIHTLW